MDVVDRGDWVPYVPDPYPEGMPAVGVLFCQRTSDQRDWYDLLYSGELQPDTVKILVMQMEGAWRVMVATNDATKLFPQSMRLLEVSGVSDQDPQKVYGGQMYDPVAKTFRATTSRRKK